VIIRHQQKQGCRAIAGRTARCCCEFRYVSKFTVASRSFHCDSNAFELIVTVDLL